MNKLFCLHPFLMLFVFGCSSSPESIKDYSTHFLCFNQGKTSKHYFSNAFAIEPTLEQKQNEILLVKLRMEKQLQTKLIDCREIGAEDVPRDLGLSPSK